MNRHRTPRAAQIWLSLMLCLVTVLQLLPAPTLEGALAAPAAAPQQPCELYPIGLARSLLAGRGPGDTLDVRGAGPRGGSRWLSWAGDLSVEALALSLQPPGDSASYRNPADARDQLLEPGDQVQVRPGMPAAADLRDALAALQQIDIAVPVGQPAAHGLGAPFVVDGFARLRVLEAPLSGADMLRVRYLGPISCDPVPLAEPADAATDEDTSVAITLRGSRAGNDPLVFQLGAPSRGTLGGLSDQSCSVEGQETRCVATVVYSPGADVNGADSFSYTVSSGTATSAPATVSLTIRPVNDSPVAGDDAASLAEDGAVTIDPLANDQDVDGDALSVSAVGAPAQGSAAIVDGGRIRYTPAANASGTDSFGYTLSDGQGGTATAMVRLTIAPGNDAPQLLAEPAALSLPEDSPAQAIRLSASDVESAADELTIAVAALPERGRLSRADGSLVTTADLLPNPVELIYTPDADAAGDDLLRATATDGGEGASPALSAELALPIALSPVNDAPTAAPRKLEGLRRGVPAEVELLGADLDSAELSLSIVAGPAHGQLGPLGAPQCRAEGAGAVCAATITYTPDADFAGSDSFTYSAGDGELSSEPATVSIVTANAAPLAPGQSASAEEDSALAIALEASDPDGDVLSFAIVAAPAHGSLTLDGASALYIPAANYHGPDSFSFAVSDGLEQSAPASVAISVAPRNDAPAFGPEASNSAQAIDEGAGLAALTASDIDGDSLAFSLREGALPAGLSLNPDGSFAGTAAPGSAGTYHLLVGLDDGAGGSASANLEIVVAAPALPLPPDPASVAPPLSAQTATSMADATRFLYSGPSPIQTGVAPGAIEERRASVLRGQVIGRDGRPIGGATIAVKDHPELGSTLTRADGRFDLAVNGGGTLTVAYSKPGLLPAQRSVEVPWERYVQLPEVVLIALDGAVTPVELGAGQPLQTARANPVTDEDGTRRATLIFPAGLSATMVLSDGTETELSTLHVRATEYTVGVRGPSTMPGELPINSAYTYAAELSVDEAIAAGASEVRFSRPVPFYLENFLNLPIGVVVPVGFYEPARAQWVGSDNGRVVKILSEAGGTVTLDIDGSGAAAAPAALDALGVTADELAELARLYEPGQSLWRSPIPHFSTPDCNFAEAITPDALKPNQQEENGEQEEPKDNAPLDDDILDCGSVIGCMNQSLGERIRVIGTPYSLSYKSDRTAGYTAGHAVEIPLSGATLPASVRAIKLEVSVAGQFFSHTFPAAPNQRYTFVWDGKDGYGRPLQGRQPIKVRIGYEYPLVYYATRDGNRRAWARVAGAAFTAFFANRRGISATIWQDWEGQVGNWLATSLGAEGWGLDIHHQYDPMGQVLLMGDGSQRSATGVEAAVITTVVGDPAARQRGDGGPALRARVLPRDVAVGPDGSIYFTEYATQTVRKVSPDGIITTIAGNGMSGGDGDGGPATQARLNTPLGLALGPDGSVYFADSTNNRIRKVDPSGIITTVAGTGVLGSGGDDGPATSAQLRGPQDVAVAADGSLYIADSGNRRIRKVNPDGTIFTIAGTTSVFVEDGPAYGSAVGEVRSIALGPDGSLYLTGGERVRRIGPDGTITTAVGTGRSTSDGDGGPAIDANITGVYDITVDQLNGDLYIAESQRVRRVRGGIITGVAGNRERCAVIAVECPEGALAAASELDLPGALAVGPDGAVYLAETSGARIRRIASFLPRLSAVDEGNLIIPSQDGSQVFRFLASGRHTQTIDALTGNLIYSFAYDEAGRLSGVTDLNGRVTSVERDGLGRATAIVAPNGQRTRLSVGPSGALEQVVLPGDLTYELGYGPGRLLTSLTKPGGGASRFTYDGSGRLLSDHGPDGAGVTLARSEGDRSFQVLLTSSMGRATSFLVERLGTGDLRTTTTGADGSRTVELRGVNGTLQITAPDGTVTTVTYGPDPRWGMLAPLVRNVVRRSPAGLQSAASTTATVQLASPGARLSMVAATNTLTRNGQTTTTTYNAAQRTITTTSPGGRTAVLTLDARGRIVENQQPGAPPLRYAYDQLGRLQSVTQGERVWAYSYDELDRLVRMTDPLNRSVEFAYDAAGRVTRQIRPDSAVIASSYTESGALASITPPGRGAHSFSHTKAGLFAGYSAPALGGEPAATTAYTYNLDRQPVSVAGPGGEIYGFAYDAAGRLKALELGAETVGLSYDAQTGALGAVTAADGGTITFGYDGSLRTSTSWAGAVAGSVGRVYTSDLRVAQLRVNGATTASYAYDADGLMRSAGALTLTRSPQTGKVESAALGGVVTSYTYDSFGDIRTTSVAHGTTALLAVEYTRDALGRVVERRETVGGRSVTEAYRYDLAGRLVEVARDGVVVGSYAYDPNGNLTAITDEAGARAGSYDGQDRLTQLGDTAYAYTAGGYLRSKTTGGQTTTYQYDLQGSLRAVALPDGTAIGYVVDGQGRRIGKTVDGALVQGFLYDGRLRPLAELDGAGAVVSQFVYGRRANVPEYMVRGGATYRIIADERGSPRLVVNAATGEVAQRMDYDIWGRVTADTNPGFQPFGFAGGLYDRQTGLVRFGARDYDAAAGRWTAKDPIGFRGGQTNLYSYVGNDPVNLTDPTGQFSWDDAKQAWENWKNDTEETSERYRLPGDMPDEVHDAARDAVLDSLTDENWSPIKDWYEKVAKGIDSVFKLRDAACEEDPGRSAAGYLDVGLDWLGDFLPIDIVTEPAKTLLKDGIRNVDSYFQRLRELLGGDTLLYPNAPNP